MDAPFIVLIIVLAVLLVAFFLVAGTALRYKEEYEMERGKHIITKRYLDKCRNRTDAPKTTADSESR